MLTYQIATDLQHSDVVTEVNENDDFLCLLSKEEKDDDVMIELPVEIPTKAQIRPGAFHCQRFFRSSSRREII